MKLSELLNGVVSNDIDLEVNGLTCDSREVCEGYVYVCIRGVAADGHSFAQNAIKAGASVIVSEEDVGFDNQIIVPDTRAAFALMSANWFANPAKSLKLIGVTGTNGKTSITYIIKKVLEDCGFKVGLIGTIHNMIGDESVPTNNTTPGPFELNRLFAMMRDADCTYVVMECSSHALEQKRIYGVEFETAIFTNLTQDHLDYHITMDNYLEAKKILFTMCKSAIINYDDNYTEKLIDGLDCKVVTYSCNSNSSTYSAKDIQFKADGIRYELVGYETIQRIKYSTGGKFSVYNSMAAAIALNELGFSYDTIANSLADFNGVKGRAEVVQTNKDYTVIIDYAHTPDGLENILSTFRDCEKNRLIVLFGCGGDRDKTKRPIMASVAARLADFVIITSDNPRTENPSEILADIIEGIKDSSTPYVVIENRTEAIKYALDNAHKDDIIVLAGKGHETYQILGTEKIHYDEREIISQILSEGER